MLFHSFSVRFIGKIVIISLFAYTNQSKSQFSDSVISNTWPKAYSGDTQFFNRVNRQIISNYNLIEKGEYQLKIAFPTPPQKNFHFRLDLELKINTSSANSIRFGFSDSTGNTQFFKIGNTQDRWEVFNSNATPIFVGPNNEFAGTSFKGSIQFLISEDSVRVTTFHSSNVLVNEFNVSRHVKDFNFIYIGIQQSGKTAIGAHRISNISLGLNNPVEFKNIKFHQINNREIELHNSTLINAHGGIVKINQRHRIYRLHRDRNILSIQLEKQDTVLLELVFDSFYSIWSEPIKPITVSLAAKNIQSIKRGDIVLSEIMTAPYPSLNRFPSTEYIELHNNSNHYKSARETILLYNQKKISLPDSLLPPQKPILLVPIDELDAWINNTAKNPVIIWGIANFPPLINSAGTFVLYNTDGVMLDSVSYESNMHLPYATEGGFSFETQNLNPYSSHNKWSSAPQNGGSPGLQNATFNHEYPIELAEIYFNEQNQIQFKLNIHHSLFDRIVLNNSTLNLFNDSPNTCWEFKINPIKPVYEGKIRFNEIYLRSENNTDFIELFNAGTHPEYLNEYDLLIYDRDHIIKQIISLENSDRKVIMPGEYLIICKNTLCVFKDFTFMKSSSAINKVEFPNLSQEGGYLALVHQLHGIIDECNFEIKNPINRMFERNTSLEKTHPLLQSNDPQNWLDCVSLFGGSPTNANSNASVTKHPSKNWIHISNKRLMRNQMEYYSIPIQLNIPDNGCLLNMHLHTIWGEKIAQIYHHLALPSFGNLEWPLIVPNKDLIRGNYIVTFEIFNPNWGTKTEFYRISLL